MVIKKAIYIFLVLIVQTDTLSHFVHVDRRFKPRANEFPLVIFAEIGNINAHFFHIFTSSHKKRLTFQPALRTENLIEQIQQNILDTCRVEHQTNRQHGHHEKTNQLRKLTLEAEIQAITTIATNTSGWAFDNSQLYRFTPKFISYPPF